jgi:alkyl hydroperoxide reductase subunit AhpC
MALPWGTCTFAPVRTTELGWMTKLKPEFDRRNTKI